MTNAGRSIWLAVRVGLARARFLAIFAVAFLVVGYWDSIKNHVDKWTRPAVAPDVLAAEGVSSVEYYCVMHPNVIRSQPGNCPICGMPLAKRKKGEKVVLPADILARVQLTPQRIALAGIATTAVQERTLVRTIEVVGVLDYAENKVAELSARVAGRADELFIKTVGQEVQRGDRVYALYSPEVYTALREYLSARQRVNTMPKEVSEADRQDMTEVYNASMQKLVLWGATAEQLGTLEQEYDKTGKVPTHFTVTAPLSGIVVRKSLFEGGYVQAGDVPFTLADLSTLWLQVQVYEQDMGLVHVGTPVEVHVEGLPGRTFEGQVTFRAYQLDPATRTLAARVEMANPDLVLRPGMFATARAKVGVDDGRINEPQKTLMNTKEGGEGAGKVERAKTFLAALEPYFTASDLLAQDKAEGVSELLHQTVTGLGALPQDAELGPRIKHVTELVHKTMGQNLDGLRESFRAMSAELIALGKTIGVPADGPTVRVFHCPMGEKPDWLQAKVETFNPYMGTRMPGCGGPTETLPKVAGAVPPRLTTGGKLVAVPRSAVIRTGKRDVVFVANPQMEGVYDLRAVTIGPAGAADGGEYYPVLSGLEPGQRVVTTGAFLLDAENRLNPTGEAQ